VRALVIISGKRASSSSHAIYRAHEQFNAVFLLRTDLTDADYNLYSVSRHYNKRIDILIGR